MLNIQCLMNIKIYAIELYIISPLAANLKCQVFHWSSCFMWCRSIYVPCAAVWKIAIRLNHLSFIKPKGVASFVNFFCNKYWLTLLSYFSPWLYLMLGRQHPMEGVYWVSPWQETASSVKVAAGLSDLTWYSQHLT